MLHRIFLCVCSWERGTELLIISFSYAVVLFKKGKHWGKQKLFCDFFSFVSFKKIFKFRVLEKTVFLGEFRHSLPRGKIVFDFYVVFSLLFSSKLFIYLNFIICKMLISLLSFCKLSKQEGWSIGNYNFSC